MKDIQLLLLWWTLGRNVYEDGYPQLAFIHRNLTYAELLSRVHDIISADLNSYVYEMKGLLNTRVFRVTQGMI